MFNKEGNANPVTRALFNLQKKKCTDSHKDQVVASKLAYLGKEQGK